MQTWLRLFRAAGVEVSELGFLRAANLGVTPKDVLRLKRHEVVPEAAIWRGGPIRKQLEKLAPDVVVIQTARSFRPEIAAGPWLTILDLVDRLSMSYAHRASLSSGPKSALHSVLSRTHRSFEANAWRFVPNVVVAGRTDAEFLGVTWVPNLIERSKRPQSMATKPFDVLFFGTLNYLPNVEALRFLAEADTAANGLSVLIAGHGPTDEVKAICRNNGWVLVEDYPSNEWLAEQANVALAPLQSTSGIQNKVLEAGAMGLAQIVSPAALAGVQGDFPAVVVENPTQLVREIKRLTTDDDARRLLADDAWAFTHAHFTTEGWVSTLWDLLTASSDVMTEAGAPANRSGIQEGRDRFR